MAQNPLARGLTSNFKPIHRLHVGHGPLVGQYCFKQSSFLNINLNENIVSEGLIEIRCNVIKKISWHIYKTKFPFLHYLQVESCDMHIKIASYIMFIGPNMMYSCLNRTWIIVFHIYFKSKDHEMKVLMKRDKFINNTTKQIVADNSSWRWHLIE